MAPIIQTCSLIAALTLAATPAAAVVMPSHTPLGAYVRALAADAAGEANLATRHYAHVLDVATNDSLLAGRAYRQAVIAGDKTQALRAARMLEAQGALPHEARLLLVAAAIEGGDWQGARTGITRIEREKAFDFIAPILQAWLDHASGQGDPFARLRGAAKPKAMEGYRDEHRILLMLASGRIAEAEAALSGDVGGSAARADLLRLRVARAKAGEAQGIDAGFGLSQLYLRLAVDFHREQMAGLAVLLSQFAVFAAPRHDEARLAAAQLLSHNGRNDQALALLDTMVATPEMASSLRGARVRVLLAQGRKEDALAFIEAAIASNGAGSGDWVLLGDVRASIGRHAEAAEAYGRAIAQLPAGEGARLADLLLLQGGALEAAGDWRRARPLLEQSVALAPESAVALNHLGYSQLERRENIAEARKLIERALALRPEDPAITDSLGWADYLLGDLDAAIPRLEAAAKGQPDGAEINEHLGDAYWSGGRRIEARYAWQAALVTADADARARLERKLDAGLLPEEYAP